MANTDYHCNTTIRNDGSGSGGGFNNCAGIDTVSTTGFNIDMPASANYFVLWEAKGFAAQ